MGKISKKVKAWKENLDSTKRHELSEALTLVKEYAKAKFPESVEVVFRLGIDPRKSDQMVRGACTLPNGTGKTVRVLVFAKGEKEKEATEAGADYVGGEELAQKIQDGWLEFDRVIATPDMMGVVGKIGRILGPRGLMPNPKVGTVTFEIGSTVSNIKMGQVQFRTDKAGNIHLLVGKAAFSVDQLKANITAVHDTLIKLKPSTAKGTYVKGVAISSTMGPGFRINPAEFA